MDPTELPSPARSAAPARPACPPGPSPARPAVTELRLSAFKSHRGARFPLGPVTLIAGPSGSGKSGVLDAYEALARLGSGAALAEAFPDPAGCVPERAGPDSQGRRGFRIGCTADGPAGPVRLDLAVQAEPALRVVGERLTDGQGRTLLATALRDPGRRRVQAEWHTAGAAPVTRAPLPDDRLATALLPLRVAGKTAGQLRVLAAAEQVVVALRSVFSCDPQPSRMRLPVPPGEGRLRRGCDNLAEVLYRTRTDCPRRHARLASVARAGITGPVGALDVERLSDGTVRAVLGRTGGAGATPAERLGEGELRYLALALVLLTGPGVFAMDRAAEVPDAMQTLTVLADGFDRSLDRRQADGLVSLAAQICAEGHMRLLGTVLGTAGAAATAAWAGPPGPGGGTDGVTVVDLTP
ncbi:ATP-binding protein [Streptomyces sp. LP05-1]|uniref:ATP-binding protein n=1 Tax=Streptomyces pyxinae TaxID=2970734 RepID=A0ABT2CDV0_9ACTN|nr:ATP-binding protein [Streptomyces sp. LP05-1]MCS0635579.1 ATP-binding protein [Streptomyces sp. LP05-1]